MSKLIRHAVFAASIAMLDLLGSAALRRNRRGQGGDCHFRDRVQQVLGYSRFILKNGLTLLVHYDQKAPVVAVNIWYHVGSKNEKPGKTGFAHLFEPRERERAAGAGCERLEPALRHKAKTAARRPPF
jgi:zinc protease